MWELSTTKRVLLVRSEMCAAVQLQLYIYLHSWFILTNKHRVFTTGKYCYTCHLFTFFGAIKKGKSSPCSITERRVPELIPVLGSQPVGDVSHKPGGRLPLSARPAATPATLKRAATSFAAWWTEAQWVWTVCLRLLADSVAAAIWSRALLRLSPAR